MDELKPEEIALNSKQYRAVELAMRDFSDKEIAHRVGVTRQLVNTWRCRSGARGTRTRWAS